jgi:hypothetical protein
MKYNQKHHSGVFLIKKQMKSNAWALAGLILWFLHLIV